VEADGTRNLLQRDEIAQQALWTIPVVINERQKLGADEKSMVGDMQARGSGAPSKTMVSSMNNRIVQAGELSC
jgi:hypothetical protein